MSPPLPKTHTHPTPLKTLAPFLLPHLPHSLPLLRRIQHRLSSPTARILATFPPPTSTTTPPPSSFSALWIDRSRAPETECWLFSTYELPSSPHTPRDEAQAKAQILALFYAVAGLPPPEPRRANDDVVVLGTLNECLLPLLAGEGLRHLVPEKVLSRSVVEDVGDARTHTESVDGEQEGGKEGTLSALSTPYMKWIIPPPYSSPSPATNEGSRNKKGKEDMVLPPGYHYDRVRPERGECKLAISRSDIPRTEETLSQLGSVGIRYVSPSTAPSPKSSPCQVMEESSNEDCEGELISWSFLSPDGSLSSLYVEPAHRGLGLAKAVSRRLFRRLADDAEGVGFRSVAPRERKGEEGEGGEGEGEEGGVVRDEAWAHSDVAVDNLGSAGVARAVGGREGWVVRWVGVDLGRVRGVVGGMGRDGGVK